MKKREKAVIFVEFKSKLDLPQSIRKSGFKTILFTSKVAPGASDLFDEIFECDLKNSKKLEASAIDLKERYLVKSVITNYDNFVVPCAYLAELFNVPATSLYSACCTRNKIMQRHALGFLKENIPYRIVKSEKSAQRAAKTLGGDVFLKAISGIKGHGVFHARDEEDIREAFGYFSNLNLSLEPELHEDFSFFDLQFHYPNPQKTFLVEKAIYGEQVSSLSIVGNHHIWQAPSLVDIYSAKSIGKDDSFLAFRILPSKREPEMVKKIQGIEKTAIRVLGLKLSATHSEFLLTEKGEIKIVELNSRIGGYRPLMYREVYGIEITDAFAKSVALGEDLDIVESPQKYVSLMEIFPEKDGELVSIPMLETLKNDPSISHIREQAKGGDKVGKSQNGHRPVLVFLISGKTYTEVYEKSLALQQDIKVEVQ